MNYTSGFEKVKTAAICYSFGARSALCKYSERTGYRKRMIAALNRLSGSPLPGPRIEIANDGKRVFLRGGRNDGE
jgi:hypothetical protein